VKIKVDENVPQRVVGLLTGHGHDALTVTAQGLAGSDDSTVARAAAEEDRMLLTLDRGFGDIRRYPPGQHPGTLVVRVDDQRPSVVEATLRALLTDYDLDEMAGCTVIAQPGLVRVRRGAPESQR
jgi:predicted nuclease of predicted toxin-antitoxin system